MSTTTAHITWNPIAGSTGVLTEYKLSSSSTWITPSLGNPTLYPYYDLEVNFNTYYDIRLTNYSATCNPTSTTRQIIAPGSACCPPGYTLSDDQTYCFQENTTVATPPTSAENTVAVTRAEYAAYGSVIYNPGYVVGGYGPFNLITLSNSFWNNQSLTTTNGPANRTGLWASGGSAVPDVGFTVCVILPSDGVYYIGCFADNKIKITVDGNTVVDMDVPAMGTYFEAHGYPAIGALVSFRIFHIYPISLTMGNHILEVIGHDDGGFQAMGAEIYNATPSDLIAATSYGDLGAKLIFSSKDYIGQPVQIGTGGVGYTCPDGYALVLCDGPAYCRQVLTTPIIAC